jgi:quinol monooxygenase YgiN
MVSLGLLIRLPAKPGKEQAVADFLIGAMPYIEQEPETKALFMIRLSPSEFGIVNAFPNEAARQAHMTGAAAEALFARAGELFSAPPAVQPIDILAAKLPG